MVAAAQQRALASCSRFCAKSMQVPDPMTNRGRCGESIRDIVAGEGIDFIFPVTEQTITLLNGIRQTLPGQVILACPPSEQMEAVSDKSRLCRLAQKLGVSAPQTVFLAGAEDLASAMDRIQQYPVVIKPSFSRIDDGGNTVAATVKYAAGPAELEELYATNPALRHPSLIQEKIVGPGTGLFTLFDRDRHLALFSHRRLREKPPSGGVSVVSESVELDEDMVEAAEKLLTAVGWSGVAMVEFKRDRRDGKAKLMEINGRFWGSLQLSIASGIDFPALLLDYLQGVKPGETLRTYRIGHTLKWFFGTLDHLLIRLKHTDAELFLPPEAPSKWQAVVDFLKVAGEGTSFDVFDRDDPRPFLCEAAGYLRQALGRS